MCIKWSDVFYPILLILAHGQERAHRCGSRGKPAFAQEGRQVLRTPGWPYHLEKALDPVTKVPHPESGPKVPPTPGRNPLAVTTEAHESSSCATAAAYMPLSSPLTFPHRGPSTAGTSSGFLLAASIWRCCVFPVCANSLSDGAIRRGPSIAGRTTGTRLRRKRDREMAGLAAEKQLWAWALVLSSGHQEGQEDKPQGRSLFLKHMKCFHRPPAAATALHCEHRGLLDPGQKAQPGQTTQHGGHELPRTGRKRCRGGSDISTGCEPCPHKATLTLPSGQGRVKRQKPHQSFEQRL